MGDVSAEALAARDLKKIKWQGGACSSHEMVLRHSMTTK